MNLKNLDKKCWAFFHELIAPKKVSMTLPVAEDILNKYFPDNGHSCIWSGNVLRRNDKLIPETGGALLSIIIPVYNNEQYISNSVDSCLAQKTIYPFEIIVINDGSTDNTAEVLQKYTLDKRVKIIQQENKGLSGARNTGIYHAIGKWIMFLDSDDTLTNIAVESLMKIAIEKDADIVEGNYEEVYTDGTRKSGCKRHSGYAQKVEKKNILSSLRGFPWGKVYKKSLFEHTHFPDNYWFEDTMMHMVIYPMAYICYTTDAIVYEYFINPSGITGSSKGKAKAIDSFYVTKRLLEDRRKLGVNFTVEDYRFFLGQVRMNWNRTRLLSERVRRAIFVETCALNRIYFGEWTNVEFDGIYSRIKESLDDKNYRIYVSVMKTK